MKISVIHPKLTKDSSRESEWLKLTFLSASSMAAFSEKKELTSSKVKWRKVRNVSFHIV